MKRKKQIKQASCSVDMHHGLKKNIKINQLNNSFDIAQILSTIQSIQPKDSSGGGGETRESVVDKLASEMLEKLPQDYLPHEIKDRIQKMGITDPLNIFLRQEVNDF